MHGDPAAALLEVLDPEQNCNFTDHYLNIPFDLSHILFIATANTITTIPPALLDRMEVIHLSGYTHEEKLKIAENYLIPKQLDEHGLKRELVQFTDDALKSLIVKYTREAGVRNLERKISAVCRALVVKVVESARDQTSVMADGHSIIRATEEIDMESAAKTLGSTVCSPGSITHNFKIIVDSDLAENILGTPIYDNEIAARLGVPGVAVGLGWTAVGGETLFVEANKIEGDGQLTLTGLLFI